MECYKWLQERVKKGNKMVQQEILAHNISPSTIFTTVLVGAATVAAVSAFITPPGGGEHAIDNYPDDKRHFPEPLQIGEITEEDLKEYDGSDPEQPILTAIKGHVYDVSISSLFYGPGGPYELFAGRDASRALAKMSFDPSDLSPDLSGLEQYELDTLNEWEEKFKTKYTRVGTIIKTPANETNTNVQLPTHIALHPFRDYSSTSSEDDMDEDDWPGSAPKSKKSKKKRGKN